MLKKARILRENPFPEGKAIRRLKTRLKSGKPIYRLRVGDYRIIYVIEGDEVFILLIVHRKDFERAIKELAAKE